MSVSKKTPKLSKQKLAKIQQAITQAHDSYKSSLEKRALYKTNNIETSHDLVQTTFLKTLLYLQKGSKIDLMRGFLNHVLDDLIVDEYRKHKTTSLEVLLGKGYNPSFDENHRIVDILDGKQLATLFPLLPVKYQSVLYMRYIQSLSLKEISLLTGQSQNTVAV